MIAKADISVKPNMRDEVRISAMRPEDWLCVRKIYLEGIATGQATFEMDAPSWEDWDGSHLTIARLVARHEGVIAGWAALSPVSRRHVYTGVAEVSIYVGRSFRGRGIGKALLQQLIDESEKNAVWTLQAAVFPENTATLALHNRCDFREVGRRERIGKLKGIWRDTVLLERRSRSVGVD